MIKKNENAKQKPDITIWSVFYFNPIATRETDQFRKEVIKIIKSYNVISYDFEELTAFMVLRTHFNLSIELNYDIIKYFEELMSNLKMDLVSAYQSYLTKLTTKFLKDIKKNRELKEATNILIKKLTLNETAKVCFTENIYQLIDTKSQFYLKVINDSLLFIANIPTKNYSQIEFCENKITITSDKPIIQLLDELILFNFAREYTIKSQVILKHFLEVQKIVNKFLKKVKTKTAEFDELLDLLKGKSFEVLDSIHDIRRQIARQNRAEREIISEIKDIDDQNLDEFISTYSPKAAIQEIVTQTDKAIEQFSNWFKHLRKIENIEDLSSEINLSEEFSSNICEMFIYMELLRIWSEFFYDISYFTVKKGRVLESPGTEIKDTIETDAVLVVEDVYKTYKLPKSRVYALRGVSFEINSGEFLAIMGPSGAGKTTLVNILTGLDSPDKGAVYLNGKNIALLDDNELTIFRRDQIGLIFQFYQLFPELTALENVSMPAEMAGIPVVEAREKARQILEIVELEMFVNQFPDKLSGGQQQRVAIARALVNNPSIVVADQLTGDLDSITGMQIIGYLRKINTESGTTVLLVTHNKAVATQADRILTIEDGEIIEEIDMSKLRQASEL
ncbi:MAG: ABC transporter ATP-binding protein [Asgard group archaeon]|nr:ABC transporter ATP-binding protein [Asgard group archaeon]